MDTRKHKTLYSGAGLFVLSNITCVHARFACAGMEGFLVGGGGVTDKHAGLPSRMLWVQIPVPAQRAVVVQLVKRVICNHLVEGSSPSGSSFLVYTKRISGRFGAYQISHRSGVLLHGTPFLFCLPGSYFINNELVINRYYNVVMSRAMSITRQPAPNAYR